MATRTRTRPEVVVNGSWTNDCRFKKSGALRWKQSGGYIAHSVTDTMVDEVTPNFYRLRAEGKVFCKHMSKIKCEEKVFVSAGKAEDATYKYDGSADYVTQKNNTIPYLINTVDRNNEIETLREIAGTQALARVTSEEILLPATLGELGETLKMLRDAVYAVANIRRSLYNCYQWTKRGNRLARQALAAERELKIRKRLKREGKTDDQISTYFFIQKVKEYRRLASKAYLKAEGAWMSARMGWRPFLGECQNLHRALTKVREGNRRQTFRGSAAKKDYNVTDTHASPMNGGTYFFRRTSSETISISAGVLCRVRIHGFPDTFGLTKLPQTIWELTTLSWAVDYFFNVGEVIAAATPDTYWEPICSWTTMKSTRVETVSYQGRNVPILTSDSVSGGLKVRVTQEKTRTPGVEIGFNFRPRLNLAKYIDLVCVGRQQFTKVVKLLASTNAERKRLKGY